MKKNPSASAKRADEKNFTIQLFRKHQNLGTIIFIATSCKRVSLQNTVSHPLGKDSLNEIFN